METTTDTERVYKVPEQNYGPLMDRIARLQRRAVKLNSEPITVTKVGQEDHHAYHVGNHDGGRVVYLAPDESPSKRFGGQKVTPLGYFRRYFLLRVEGAAPKLNDWTFIGAIDTVRDEEGNVVGNLVRTIPDREMPTQYRTSNPHCDHCGVDRRWKSTFVIQHLDGTNKQVGRQCLRDFTGHQSPETVASYAENLCNVGDMLSEAEWDDFEGGGAYKRRFRLESLLVTIATMVRVDGWKSKASAQEHLGQTSTATRLSWFLTVKECKALDEARIRYTPTEIDQQTPNQPHEWLVSLSDKETKSDYESNLAVIAMAGIVEEKMFGFVASAVPSFLKSRDRLAARKFESQTSQYIGKEKERMETVLTVVTFHYVESPFGTKTIVKFRDVSGNVVIWKTTADPGLTLDSKVNAKFTVKEHSEYREVKQTIVLRLTVLETIQDQPVLTA